MRTNIYALLLAALFTSCTATENQKKQDKTEPVSTTVRLLEGDMPDPSVVRVGNTYYMVHSSFIYTPGLVGYKIYNFIIHWFTVTYSVF